MTPVQSLFAPEGAQYPLRTGMTWSAVLVAAALATACGGNRYVTGGAGGTVTTRGVVAGGHYRNARVCVDANRNGRCDPGEASATVGADGRFILPGQGPLAAEIGAGSTRLDPATGRENPVAQPLVFRAPAGADVAVSAVSTELVAMTDADGGDAAAARRALARRIGVSEAQLLADPDTLDDAAARAALQTENDQALQRIADAVAEAGAGAGGDLPRALRNRLALEPIRNVVVIYAENRSFDNLYGLFPGANGIPGVNPSARGSAVPQKDFDGSTLPALPPVWGGLTAAGQAVTVTQAQTVGMPNRPFRVDDPAGFYDTGTPVAQSVITRDLVHRFYNNQMQIDGGRNDRFAAYSDAGALSMSYYDGSRMKLWQIARQYTLADNFFMGAFGGSYLNHQYLICACMPIYPNADAPDSPARNSISAIDVDANGNFVRLTPAANAPTSVLNGAALYKNDGNLTPKDAAGNFYAVNTVQPAYQPSGNPPAANDASGKFADPAKATTLPPQTQATIGDRLTAKGIDWAWYSGAWDAASANRKLVYNNTVPNFQSHHQPFNYYQAFDPVAHPEARAAHLKDFDADFLKDVANGTLPPVAFYKPQGNLNQHSGYASVADGDAHIAGVIAKLQASPQWQHMLVVVTYDENGGIYDHAVAPKGDRWGPGTRIPALIVSPFARRGYVDDTQYDTGSILRFISHRWSLPPLPGVIERDAGLVNHGGRPMGDLTNALDFGR